MFSVNNVLLDFEAKDSTDFLNKISDYLCEKKYVNNDFKESLIKREKEYPTGLPTEGVKIALPHTDAEYALMPAIFIIKFKNEIAFKQMGDGIKDIYAKMAFVLVITDPASQVKVLQSLMSLFCKQGSLERIYNSSTKEEVYYNTINELSGN